MIALCSKNLFGKVEMFVPGFSLLRAAHLSVKLRASVHQFNEHSIVAAVSSKDNQRTNLLLNKGFVKLRAFI